MGKLRLQGARRKRQDCLHPRQEQILIISRYAYVIFAFFISIKYVPLQNNLNIISKVIENVSE